MRNVGGEGVRAGACSSSPAVGYCSATAVSLLTSMKVLSEYAEVISEMIVVVRSSVECMVCRVNEWVDHTHTS